LDADYPKNGVKIARRNTLVTRNVEPYAIVGGNPARTIRSRFDAADVELLLEMKWWDWADHRLRDAMPVLTSGDIRALHAYWRTFD
jgi:chloramphenicol O-acetyltransferase type B